MTKLAKLTKFLDRLDASEIHYVISSVREAAVMVAVTIPGERWEVEFMADGEVEVEIFTSDDEIYEFEMVETLFERHSDRDGPTI